MSLMEKSEFHFVFISLFSGIAEKALILCSVTDSCRVPARHRGPDPAGRHEADQGQVHPGRVRQVSPQEPRLAADLEAQSRCYASLLPVVFFCRAQSTLDNGSKHKQIEPVVANGSVHTGHKQQLRNCLQICVLASVVLCCPFCKICAFWGERLKFTGLQDCMNTKCEEPPFTLSLFFSSRLQTFVQVGSRFISIYQIQIPAQFKVPYKLMAYLFNANLPAFSKIQ